MQRKIIHLDCDCFYAAIEMRDNPSLRNQAVAVGGRPELRGVIATCNYPARRFGIHSAMPSAQAFIRCPDLILLPVNMDKYRRVSQQILSIYRQYTPLVEPLSLDEAYLDVSESDHCQGSATWIAQEIQARISSEIGISVSAGIAPNKFLAKIASDWQKPNGFTVIHPADVSAFVAALPVEKLFGVGPVTAKKLNDMRIYTCQDLRSYPVIELERRFGRFGRTLYELAHGIDPRPVIPQRQRKSVSVEKTFAQDMATEQECICAITELNNQLHLRIQRAHASGSIVKLFVKIRFHDFKITTIERMTNQPKLSTFIALFQTAMKRRKSAIRLIGVGVRLAAAPDADDNLQLSLFT